MRRIFKSYMHLWGWVRSMQEPAINRQRSLHHGVNAVALHDERAAGLIEPGAQMPVSKQPEDRAGEGCRILGRHEQSGLFIFNNLGDAADIRRHHRCAEDMRVQNTCTKSFEDRAHDKNVKPADKLPGVRAVPREDEPVTGSDRMRDPFNLGAFAAVADKDHTGFRFLLPDEGTGPDQHFLRLVPPEMGHIADNRRRFRNAEFTPEIAGWRCFQHLNINAGGNQIDFVRRNTVPDHDRFDTFGNGDKAIDAETVFEEAQSKRRMMNREVDAPGNDDAPDPREAAGKSAERVGMRAVRVYNIRPDVAEQLHQLEDGRGVQRTPQRQFKARQAVPPGALNEWASGISDHCHIDRSPRQTLREVEGLLLTAAPCAFGINMNGFQNPLPGNAADSSIVRAV